MRTCLTFPVGCAGHIWATLAGVHRLARARGAFAANMNPVAVSPEAKLDLSAYLEKATAADEAAREGMIELLRQLSTKGWAEVEDGDPRAELAARHNLSGTISVSTLAPGLPLEALDPVQDGQVAVVSSQAMRLKIAHALQRLDRRSLAVHRQPADCCTGGALTLPVAA